MPQPNVDTTFLTQMGAQRDISEHLNRITKHATTNDGNIYSAMTQNGPGSQAAHRESNEHIGETASGDGGFANRYDTADNPDAYALVPRKDDDDNLLRKTY